jgi:DNA-directed RNA polymerase subunit omega
MVAKRVRQIREGSEYLISSPKNEDIVISLREVAAGKVQLRTESRLEALPEPEPEASEEEVQEVAAAETVEAVEPEAPPAEDSEETAAE